MPQTHAPPVIAPPAWRLAQLSAVFLFDIARISRGEGDLLEPVILTAILQANQAPIAGDPELQLLYGAAAWSLPDEHRRAIPIHAIAQSLGLPFETVRRKVQVMGARGLCVVERGGVIVPQRLVTSEAYRLVQARRVERLAALHDELTQAGLQAPRPEAKALLSSAPRAADRVLGDYMLRACDGLLALTGGAMDGMVLLALAAVNVGEVRPGSLAGWASYAKVATPCRGSRLARELAMPGETVRRHLHRLSEAGFCRRVSGGWIAAAPEAAWGELGRLVESNAQDLRRMLAALGELSARGSGREETRAL